MFMFKLCSVLTTALLMLGAGSNVLFNFKVVSVAATGLMMLSAGSYAIADDDDDEDENEVSVEIEATNDDGYRLEVEAEGTSLGFIDEFDNFPLPSDGDLSGEAKLTDPDGNECEVEIGASQNGIGRTPGGGTIPRLFLFSESGVPLLFIVHGASISVRITEGGKFLFDGCNVGPPMEFIIFPGDQTEIEIEQEG